MTVRKFQLDNVSVVNILLQYESLRLQVLNRPGDFSERGLGLALFVRRGMLACIEVYRESSEKAGVLLRQAIDP